MLWGKAQAVNPRGIAIFVYKWRQARVGDREAIRLVSSRIGIWVDWTRSMDEITRSKVRKFAKLYQSTVIKQSSPSARDRAWSAYLRQRESCHLTIQATKCRRLYCTDWHCQTRIHVFHMMTSRLSGSSHRQGNVGVKMIRDGSMTKPCLPRVAAQPQMTLSFFKPYLSPRWRYCDVMTQLDKTPQWARGDHLRHGNRDNGSDSRGYGVTIRSHWWPLVTLLYLMCW